MGALDTAPAARRSAISRVLVANRGEIARRVMRTCRELGIETVAVFSDADADAPHVAEATVAVRLPGNAPADTYLRMDLLLAAARATGADAVHPGYGFLAESAAFASAVLDGGLVWIGPPPSAIAAMGSKIEAKRLMRAAEVPVLPDGADAGFPTLVKASAGGGGRGMRIVRTAAELDEAVASAGREAAAAFGDGTVFVERYVERGRHIEIQVFADTHGNCVSLHERECSIQRRHQKIVEESPSPVVTAERRAEMGAAAVAAARAVGYVGAGTVEFLVSPEGEFFFLEMNTRLQVEHPVTELVTGLDLVALQIAVAEGGTLPDAALHPRLDGHAIEVRLCAEDPAAGYLPQVGRLDRFTVPAGPYVRLDTGVETGSAVSPYYDSMLAKIVAWGPTRDAAARVLAAAVSGAEIHGVTTNRDQLVQILRHPQFLAGEIDTAFLERNPCTDEPGGDAGAAAVAVALAVQAARRETATTLPGVPSGWRNVPSQDQLVLVRWGERLTTVGYRFDRHGSVVRVTVDGEDAGLAIFAITSAGVVVGRDGVRTSYAVHLVGDRADVDAPDRSWTFVVSPRFPLPDDAGLAGSLVAPMPGAILRVLAAAGDAVSPGQPLVVLEAMKMEHQVVAPRVGTVASVLVVAGQQVTMGEPLLVLEAVS